MNPDIALNHPSPSQPAAWWIMSILAVSFFGLAPGGTGPKATGSARTNPKPPSSSSVQCGTPLGDPFPAERILQDLIAGRDVDIQGRIIDGSLDADSISPATDDRKPSLRLVRGRLRLDSCRITGRFNFPRAEFTKDVIMTCTEVLGDVDLSDSEIRGSFTADGNRFLGDVRLPRAFIEGDLSLRDTVLTGSLDLSGARMRVLKLNGADLRRNVELTRSVTGAIDASSASIAGSMRLDDVLLLGGLSAHEANFGRGLSIGATRVNGQVDLSGATGSGGVSLSNLVVEGSLLVQPAVEGPLSMTDVTVTGSLSLVDGRFGEVSIQRLQVRGPSEMNGASFGKTAIRESDFGSSFRATEAVFRGDTEFRRVRFPGDDPMLGALFASAPVLIDTILPGAPSLIGDENADPEDYDEGDEQGDEQGNEEPQADPH